MTTVNILNFVRATEPRLEMDLFGCLEKQLACMKKYGLKSTLLLQYDALINEEYRNLIKQYEEYLDIGVWLEIVRPLCNKAGVKYNGRLDWDWDHHSNATFAIGYDVEDRYKLIDVAMEDYKAYFGKYPNIVGSWTIDAKSMLYLKTKYGIIGSMNCIDQMGIDGYTFWGGYPAGAYYPSINNVFCPANDISQQINLPVFRFSGVDLIHYYGGTQIYTLEPAALDAGGNESWTKWYYEQVLSNPSLNFSYLQTGQENSFGWNRLGKGFERQCQMISEYKKNGKVQLQTMTETSRDFMRKFSVTPAIAKCFMQDWSKEDKQSVWYVNRFYRAALLADEQGVTIRDIFRFDSNLKERYLNKKELTRSCFYTNVEVFSGLSRRDDLKPAGYLRSDKTQNNARMSVKEVEKNELEVLTTDGFRILFEEMQMSIFSDDGRPFSVEFIYRQPPMFNDVDDHEGIDFDAMRRMFNPPEYEVEDNTLKFRLEREGDIFAYEVDVLCGNVQKTQNGFTITAKENKGITLFLAKPGTYI